MQKIYIRYVLFVLLLALSLWATGQGYTLTIEYGGLLSTST